MAEGEKRAVECGWEGALERGKKRPTVGRRKNLLWVVKTTYRRSSMRSTVGRNKEKQEALRSLLELVRREVSLIFSQMNIIEAPTLRRVMNSHSVDASIYGPGESRGLEAC